MSIFLAYIASLIMGILGFIIGTFSLISVILFSRVLFRDPLVSLHRIRLYKETYKLLSLIFLMNFPFMAAFLFSALSLYPSVLSNSSFIPFYVHVALATVLIYTFVIGLFFFKLYLKTRQQKITNF